MTNEYNLKQTNEYNLKQTNEYNLKQTNEKTFHDKLQYPVYSILLALSRSADIFPTICFSQCSSNHQIMPKFWLNSQQMLEILLQE